MTSGRSRTSQPIEKSAEGKETQSEQLIERKSEGDLEQLSEQPPEKKAEQSINTPYSCDKIKHYVRFFTGATFGFGSSVSNALYAIRFATGTPATKTISFNLSPARIAAGVFTGITTEWVSGSFGCRYVQIAMLKIQEEVYHFRHRINTKRFITETTMSFLAAITGGAIAGGAYTGEWQWAGRLLGFGMIFSLSFLGLCELIIKLTDKNYAFQLTIIDHLKRMSPRYHSQVNELLQNKELNKETLPEFLTKVFTLAKTTEDENLFRNQKISEAFFREKTLSEYKKEKICKIVDFGIASIFTGFCSFMYMQGGFLGTNIILNNLLDDISNIAKICIGASVGFPLAIFIFFNVTVLNSPIVELYPEIKNDFWAMLKMLSLIVLNAGNATWYYGLAEKTADNENIFSGALDSTLGHDIFPIITYLTCFILGMNGLTPTIIPIQINTKHPQLEDVIKYLKLNFSPTVMEGLRKHSCFKRDEPEKIELKNTEETRQIPRIISSHVA